MASVCLFNHTAACSRSQFLYWVDRCPSSACLGGCLNLCFNARNLKKWCSGDFHGRAANRDLTDRCLGLFQLGGHHILKAYYCRQDEVIRSFAFNVNRSSIPKVMG